MLKLIAVLSVVFFRTCLAKPNKITFKNESKQKKENNRKKVNALTSNEENSNQLNSNQLNSNHKKVDALINQKKENSDKEIDTLFNNEAKNKQISSNPKEIDAFTDKSYLYKSVLVSDFEMGELKLTKTIFTALNADSISQYKNKNIKFFEKRIGKESRIICFEKDGTLYIPYIQRFCPLIFKIKLNTANFDYDIGRRFDVVGAKKDRVIYIRKTDEINYSATFNYNELAKILYEGYKEAIKHHFAFSENSITNDHQLVDRNDSTTEIATTEV